MNHDVCCMPVRHCHRCKELYVGYHHICADCRLVIQLDRELLVNRIGENAEEEVRIWIINHKEYIEYLRHKTVNLLRVHNFRKGRKNGSTKPN